MSQESRRAVLHVALLVGVLALLSAAPWPRFNPTLARTVGVIVLVAAVVVLATLVLVSMQVIRLGGAHFRRRAAATFVELAETTIAALVGTGSTAPLEEVTEEARELFEDAGVDVSDDIDPTSIVEDTMTIAWTVFGRAVIALAFFLFWACMHLLVWSYAPPDCPANPEHICGGAYFGAGAQPTLGDFVYLAVNAALVNFPPDMFAASRGAHAAVVAELVSGVAVVTAFASVFLGMGRNTGVGSGSTQAVADSSAR